MILHLLRCQGVAGICHSFRLERLEAAAFRLRRIRGLDFCIYRVAFMRRQINCRKDVQAHQRMLGSPHSQPCPVRAFYPSRPFR